MSSNIRSLFAYLKCQMFADRNLSIGRLKFNRMSNEVMEKFLQQIWICIDIRQRGEVDLGGLPSFEPSQHCCI